MRKQFTIFLILVFILGLVPINFSKAEDLPSRLKGKILLQVENHGEAWYVHPAKLTKHYMANGDEAYNIMRNFGVGITNNDLAKLQNNSVSAKKHSGKIFLQVESHGEAYYVNSDGKLYYLKNGGEAYNIMRTLGLGITNKDLSKISGESSQMSDKIETPNIKKLTNSEIIKKIKQAVVYIETTEGSGSGMVIEAEGYILTNAHVVTGFQSAKIGLYDGATKTASVVGRDENLDLALLKIDSGIYSKIDFGDSDAIEQGEEIFTLGFPFGIKGDVSFKEGTISRRLEANNGGYLEISAEIHPGNSGGPLVNQYGQVIGVNTAGIGQSVNGLQIGETIKLAIPINVAISLIPKLKTGLNVIDTHALEQKETEAQARAQQEAQAQAEARVLQAEAERQAQIQREAQLRAEREAEAFRQQMAQRQALLAQRKVECDNPINEWKQQILQLKSDYYKKKAEIEDQSIPMASIYGQINRLIDDTNAQIDIINNNIQQKTLQCSIKFGDY